ncbi:thiopeptide-type bacteriocin biosynthesis protein [Chitinophaga dinghuensis]|uniref:Thiopeptide-type bacteriocin biosynthesis protein n=1 Tax=Chitinophaga dinghuensis TaxID=1539050 RepID=A0A327VLF1_9BACT|nr:lantibiotic dehydratase [Chitinophaga dinghuensis]RAJ74057.1 thiopeptide-type bacteriocin biosynthesis protein [Chitinophaga dinghuensis]
MKFNVESFGKFIYRIPQFPLEKYLGAGKYQDINSYLKDILASPEVQNALFFASDNFLKEVTIFLEGGIDEKDYKRMQSFQMTALKYLNRMATRCTPFGTFAGLGIGTLSQEQDHIAPNSELKEHLYWDTAFLLSIMEAVTDEPANRPYIRFFPNNSIYCISDIYRYIEFNYDSAGRRNYSLSTFRMNKYLSVILKSAAAGPSFNELAAAIVDDEIEYDDAAEFLHELINERILISEFEPWLVGARYEDQLLELIGNKLQAGIPDLQAEKRFRNIWNLLKAKNDITASLSPSDNNVEVFRQLAAKAGEFPLKFSTTDYFQMDAEVEAAANLSYNAVINVKNGVKSLFKLAGISRSSESLEAFKKKFETRYEQQSVRLVELMDPEYGIAYNSLSESLLYHTPLVDDVPVNERPPGTGISPLMWDNRFHTFLFRKIQRAQQQQSHEVVITPAELELFTFDMDKIPPTLNAFVSIIPNESGKPLVHFRDWGSDTALTLLGRFSIMNPEMRDVTRKIADFEDACYSRQRFKVAEITHLADPRVGNITTRSSLRDYEIGYITKSNSTEPGIIRVDQLYVRLENKVFHLYNEKNERIIPVLSNAHNTNKHILPLYKFLYDLQNEHMEGVRYMSLNLGPINKILEHVPRIRYENYIFRPASWSIYQREFTDLWDLNPEGRVEKIRSVLREKNIPDSFFVFAGDNRLFIDMEKCPYPSAMVLADMLAKNPTLIVEENLYAGTDRQLIHNDQGNYLHEIVIPFKNLHLLETKQEYLHLNATVFPKVSRDFPPGSEWLYIKIYTGVTNADKLIREHLPGMIERMKTAGLISSWFFLRFHDPESHIRLRFHLRDVSRYGELFRLFYEVVGPFMNNDFIDRISMDTYKREIERYGGPDRIAAAEQIFCLDSEVSVNLLQLLDQGGHPSLNWLPAVIIFDVYMDAFSLNMQQKHKYVMDNRDWFAMEFRANKAQRRKMGTKYREHFSLLDNAIKDRKLPFSNAPQIAAVIEEYSRNLRQLVLAAYPDSHQQIGSMRSFIHMFLLRFLLAKNRMHEYTIYSLLELYYKSIIATRINISDAIVQEK